MSDRIASIFLKLLLGALSVVSFWLCLVEFGTQSFRVYAVLVLLVAGVYYTATATALAFNPRLKIGMPSPLCEGAIIVSLFLVGATAIFSNIWGYDYPTLGPIRSAIVYGVLPVLALSNWLIFSEKGRWSLISPFYWLAPPAIFAAFIIISAILAPTNATGLFPAEFLNYLEIGFGDFLIVLTIFITTILAFGYLLVLIDSLMSKKLSHYVVLPKIKVVEK